MLKDFFFFLLRRDSSGFLAASVKGRANVNMTSFFPTERRGLKRGGYKDPIRSHLRGSRQDNYKLYESTQPKKWKKPTKKMDRLEKKITFPLGFRFLPPLTRKGTAAHGRGLLQEASCGFLRCGKEAQGTALLVFLQLIKAEPL